MICPFCLTSPFPTGFNIHSCSSSCRCTCTSCEYEHNHFKITIHAPKGIFQVRCENGSFGTVFAYWATPGALGLSNLRGDDISPVPSELMWAYERAVDAFFHETLAEAVLGT